jgi:glucose/arabinose dehydrogenase
MRLSTAPLTALSPRRLALAILVLLAVALAAFAFGDEEENPPVLRVFGGHPFDSPYYVAGAPEDPSRVFVVEGPGRIRLVRDGRTLPDPFLNITRPVCFADEGCGAESGLLSLAFALDYEESGRFFVFYTRDAHGEHDLVIEEFRRSQNPDRADKNSRRLVIRIPHRKGKWHNGGQLQFGPDGMLYISAGDAQSSEEAQDRTSLLGKLLRVDVRDGAGARGYSIPPDNPYVQSGPRGYADEIYAYGFRNPWRFSFDRMTADLIIGDVGEHLREEIDFAPNGTARGRNFGWDCFEGSVPNPIARSPTCAEGVEAVPPVLEYTDPDGRAVVGGYVVRDRNIPSLYGHYLYADSIGAFDNEIRSARLQPEGANDEASVGVEAESVVSFGEDACGHIYVASAAGPVYRLEPTDGSLSCSP